MIQGNLFPILPISEPEHGKVCSYCGIKKGLNHFGKQATAKDKKDHRCNRCKREQSQLRDRLRKTAPEKPPVCDCCSREYHLMCLDHDHLTNRFRGWLCHKCNSGIGHLGDTIEGLENALAYLRKHNEKD
jgi:hypothetical protein